MMNFINELKTTEKRPQSAFTLAKKRNRLHWDSCHPNEISTRYPTSVGNKCILLSNNNEQHDCFHRETQYQDVLIKYWGGYWVEYNVTHCTTQYISYTLPSDSPILIIMYNLERELSKIFFNQANSQRLGTSNPPVLGRNRSQVSNRF